MAETADQLRVTAETYPSALDALVAASRVVLDMAEQCDITAMRSLIGHYEAVAPIVEPTEYLRGGGQNLADQAAFLAAVDEFVTKLRRLDRTPDANRGSL